MNTKLNSPTVAYSIFLYLRYLGFIAIYLTACAGGPQIAQGDVINLFHGTAEWIMDGCASGECGAHIFAKNNILVYARPLADNVAFVVTDKGIPVEKLSGLTGNLISCATWECFKEWMTANGFQVVPVIAPAYRVAVETAMTIARMELLPVFAIWTAPQAGLPEWIMPETSIQ